MVVVMELKQLNVGFSIKAVSDGGHIEGYGSVFGVKDSYSDIVAKGAFAKSLAEHKTKGSMPALLWQHRMDEPIGVWEAMEEDDNGLMVKGRLALETVRGKEAHVLMKMGALTGLSIGFYSKEWMYDRESDIRTLTEIDLWEVSPVTFPANQAAKITAVKSIESLMSLKDVEHALREKGFTKTEATALVAKIKGLSVGDQRQTTGGPGDPVAELVAALTRRGSALGIPSAK